MEQYHFPDRKTLRDILKRPSQDFSQLLGAVQPIFDAVRQTGDDALFHFTKQFDKVSFTTLSVEQSEIDSAEHELSEDLKTAIRTAAENITKFHAAQLKHEQAIETMPGVLCWRENRAIQRVGLYIPGGSAPLFSTVLMLGIPAKIAGCKEVVLCSPPNADGNLHPAILYSAQLCGISRIFRVGGAQAVAAMTFGTQSIPSIFKIFGPGNAYVTVAKQLAQQYGLAIDMPAGPSEVMVIADHTAKPDFVAADLLSQAEHGADSQVVLVADNAQFIADTLAALQHQLAKIPRSAIAEKALKHSKVILVNNVAEAIEIANDYAPEHLILSVQNAETHLQQVISAGSVFIGNFTPESCGDYASGTNHTLPTNGFSHAFSGVSVDSFLRKMTVQNISEKGLKNLAKTVVAMAENEGLQAHANAVKRRLETD